MKNIHKNEVIDLTNLNVFDTIKKIIVTTNYSPIKSKNTRYKVVSADIQNLLKDIPIKKSIELVTL